MTLLFCHFMALVKKPYMEHLAYSMLPFLGVRIWPVLPDSGSWGFFREDWGSQHPKKTHGPTSQNREYSVIPASLALPFSWTDYLKTYRAYIQTHSIRFVLPGSEKIRETLNESNPWEMTPSPLKVGVNPFNKHIHRKAYLFQSFKFFLSVWFKQNISLRQDSATGTEIAVT